MDAARFWLERGVDGFRLDALNHAMHDPQLRNNPPAPETGRVRTRPFDYQIKRYSQSQPGMLPFIERIRALCDEFGAIHLVAEVGGDDAITEMKAYTAGQQRLSSAYGFDFLYAPTLTPAMVARAMAEWPGMPGADGLAEGWPSWAFENHDAPRAVSRWCAPEHREVFARMKIALLAALRGNIIVYQGEDLGRGQDDIPFEQLRDPEAIANWPLTLSRDGARTPLPWTADQPHGGFTTGTPWLPVSDANRARAFAVQEADPGSLLHHTRHVLAQRQATPALRLGEFRLVTADAAGLGFERVLGDERVACRFNLSGEPVRLSASGPGTVLLASPGVTEEGLPPFGFEWRRLD